MLISREQVVRRLRDADWKFHRPADRVEFYKKGVQRLTIARKDLYPETYVRTVLGQAGLSAAEVEEFLRSAVKS